MLEPQLHHFNDTHVLLISIKCPALHRILRAVLHNVTNIRLLGTCLNTTHTSSLVNMGGYLQSATGLLDLPGELRNKIYDLVLNGADEDIMCPFVWQISPGKRKYGYSLTQTSHQIRQETLFMWHAGKKLLFAMRADNMKYYKNWLKRRADAAFQSIRQIYLEDYQHCKQRSPPQHPHSCRSAIIVNLAKGSPVSWRRDRRCYHCPRHDAAVDRVNAVARTLKKVDGRRVLTREKLEEIFEAAAWEI